MNEVIIPFDVVPSKKFKNIDSLIHLPQFLSNCMNKIYSNIDIIHEMLYQDLKDICYVAK